MNLFIKFAEFIVVKPLMDEFVVVAAHTYTTEQLCRLCPALQAFNGLHGHRCDRPLNRLYNYITTKLTEKMEENKQQMILEALKGTTFNATNIIIGDDAHVNNYASNNDGTAKATPNEETKPQVEEQTTQPAVVIPEEIMPALKKLQEHGYLNDEMMPTKKFTRTKQGYAVSMLADKYLLDNCWVLFASLWKVNKDTLRAAYHRGMNQVKAGIFMEDIKESI